MFGFLVLRFWGIIPFDLVCLLFSCVCDTLCLGVLLVGFSVGLFGRC